MKNILMQLREIESGTANDVALALGRDHQELDADELEVEAMEARELADEELEAQERADEEFEVQELADKELETQLLVDQERQEELAQELSYEDEIAERQQAEDGVDEVLAAEIKNSHDDDVVNVDVNVSVNFNDNDNDNVASYLKDQETEATNAGLQQLANDFERQEKLAIEKEATGSSWNEPRLSNARQRFLNSHDRHPKPEGQEPRVRDQARSTKKNDLIQDSLGDFSLRPRMGR